MAAVDDMNIATGLKDALLKARMSIEKILNSKPSRISNILGVDQYVAKLIYEEAKKAVTFESITIDT
jgi:ERCC4-type nuclease